MAESKENKLPENQQATWPLLSGRLTEKTGSQSGEDLLARMEDTVANKPFTDTGVFETATIFTGGAIKVLAPDKPLEEVSRQRFQREAQATAALHHPNIISVHDFGVLENGALYLAMEYLEGETLASRLERTPRLDLDSALPIFKQICLALDYAHKQGIVHRDLKPSNIMLVKDDKNEDQAIVIDFSIAKFTRKKPTQNTITRPGQIFGSPLYMSPEQCQGKKPDHRSDIYSMGCLMYETLCGIPPFIGDSNLTTIYKHVNELPAPFSRHVKDDSLPGELQSIVFKALAKQPENRYQSASELAQALENLSQQKQPPNIKKGIISSFPLKWMSKILISMVIPLLLFIFVCMLIASGVQH